MGELDDSDKYEGQLLCSPSDVKDELGPIVTRNSTIFPEEDWESLIGEWCKRETAKFMHFMGILYSQLEGDLLWIARDCVLYRVSLRVMRKAQANRTHRPGGTPSYDTVITYYDNEIRKLELSLSTYFKSGVKKIDQPYPPSVALEVTVIVQGTSDILPGSSIYVDNEFIDRTGKDGVQLLYLPTKSSDDDSYDVMVKAVGYKDSATQVFAGLENGDLVFEMEEV